MDTNWFAVQVQTLHERKVTDRLNECGITAFLPTYEVPSLRQDRKAILTKPLFPGYLFVQIPFEYRYRVLTTNSVIRILGEVPNSDIEALQMADKSNLQPVQHIPDGSRVRVANGPFRGCTGLLTKHNGNCRVSLTLEAISQSFSVEVNESDVEAIS